MFQNPFSFDGRIRRTEFGVSFIIYMVCYFIVLAIASKQPLAFLILIPVLWFLWAQGAKRCHDLGKNGWWQIIPFYVFWLLFVDGNPGENQYGDDPKGRMNPFEAYDFSMKPNVGTNDSSATKTE